MAMSDAEHEKMVDKKAARRLQKSTGRKYTDCLEEVRLTKKIVQSLSNKTVGEN